MKHPRFALPHGVNLSDFEWEPLPPTPTKPKKKTHRGTRGRRRRRGQQSSLKHKAEFRLRVLSIKQAEFENQYLRIRAKQIVREIEQDKIWLRDYAEREAARERAEAEMKRVRDWFAAEHAKEVKRNTTR